MKREVRAMMTLEAAVILPITMVVSILLLWTGILLYNRTAVEYALSVSVIRAARQAEWENDDILALAESKAQELLEERLVAMESGNVEVRVSGDKVSASFYGCMRSPLEVTIGDIRIPVFEVEQEYSSPRLWEAMTVRSLKRLTQ